LDDDSPSDVEPDEPAATEPETEPEPQEAEPTETWTKTAVLDERKKRQEAEARLREMELQIARFQGAAQFSAVPPKKDEPPNFSDLIDFADLPGSLPRAVEKIFEHHFSQRQTAAEKERETRWVRKRDLSIEVAKEDHADYDNVIQQWVRAYDAAATYAQRTGDASEVKKMDDLLRHASSPAEYAYRWSKKRMAESEKGTELEKLRKEIAALREGRDLEAEDEDNKPKPRPSVGTASGRGGKPFTKGKKAVGGSPLDGLDG